MKVRLILSILIIVSATSILGSDLKSSPWHIPVNENTNYTGVSIANGKIGLLSSEKPFETRWIILNNVYDKESKLGVSKVLKGINFGNLHVEIDGELITETNISNWEQVLNLKEGSLTTSFEVDQKAFVSYTIYALRQLPYMGLIDVKIKAKKDINLKIAGVLSSPKEYKNPINTFRVLRDLEVKMPLLQTVAKSQFERHTLATTAAFLFDKGTPELKHVVQNNYNHNLEFEVYVKKREDYNFAWSGAVCTTGDFEDPQSESERMTIFTLLEDKENILYNHKSTWAELWESDIEIVGDLESQRDVRLALYNLYAFSREGSELSISPMGLSSQGYNGHIFWDTELWMYPPLLLLNQDIAKSLLDYRQNKLDKAIEKAQNFGYGGAMYPWESDDTGEEATPTWALTGTFEHHITADVGIAFWNYFRVTQDIDWLREKGYPLLKEIADFWVSRSTQNIDGSYSIKNVVGANEFAQNIDDNAFTNGSAKVVLEYAAKAAKTLGFEPDTIWMDVSNKLLIHKFEDGVTRENATYKGEVIKQADVNLLAYPLGLITDEETIVKDLEYYEPKMAEEGPAMSHSILSILYSRLGNNEKAFELFKRGYEPNKRPPFGALSESALINNPYFATAAGGMLQSIIFGFAGLEITEKGIMQNKTCLPIQWEKLILKGIGPNKNNFTIKH
jgi:kojibiose hydrolase